MAQAANRGRSQPQAIHKLAYSINEAVEASGLGRARLYQEIKLGRLRAVKSGKRTLIPADALRELISVGLPDARKCLEK